MRSNADTFGNLNLKLLKGGQRIMDQESSKKENLPNLPPSEDKDFWLEAEIHTGLVPEEVNKGGEHYFVRTTGRQAQCQHCDWGFELDPGDKIVDGHLYDRKGKLVI